MQKKPLKFRAGKGKLVKRAKQVLPSWPNKLFLFLYIFPCRQNDVDHFCLLALHMMNEYWISIASIFIRHVTNLDDELRGP